MSPYQQSAPEDVYRNIIRDQLAKTLAQKVNTYDTNRAVVLGIPMYSRGQNGFAPVDTGPLTMRQRIAAWGTAFADLVQDNATEKGTIEAQVIKAVEKLGGYDAIDPKGPYGFVLSYVPQDGNEPKRNDDGKIVGPFSLPGLPFRFSPLTSKPGEVPRVYEVDLDFSAADGSAVPTFKAVNKSAKDAGDADPV